MTVEKLKQRYKVIEAKRINDDIVSIDLYHDEEKSNYLHIKLLFAYNKLYYTGDFGTYVFGKDIQNIFNFFKGVRFDERYWQEKCEAASDPIIPDEVDLEKVEEAVRDYLEARFIYACEVIQWVSNNLEEWLGENKNGTRV